MSCPPLRALRVAAWFAFASSSPLGTMVPPADARHCGTVNALDALSLTVRTFLELYFLFSLKADIKS